MEACRSSAFTGIELSHFAWCLAAPTVLINKTRWLEYTLQRYSSYKQNSWCFSYLKKSGSRNEVSWIVRRIVISDDSKEWFVHSRNLANQSTCGWDSSFSWEEMVSAVSAPWALRTALMAGRGSLCPRAEGWWFCLPGWFGADCLALPSTVDKDQSFEVLHLLILLTDGSSLVGSWIQPWPLCERPPRTCLRLIEPFLVPLLTDTEKMLHMKSKHHRRRSVCMKGIYVGKRGMETQKEKGLDTRIS